MMPTGIGPFTYKQMPCGRNKVQRVPPVDKVTTHARFVNIN